MTATSPSTPANTSLNASPGPIPSAANGWHWEPQPKGQALINDLLAGFLAACPDAQRLKDRMTAESGTRFHDWVDHIALPRATPNIKARLAEAGFDHTPLPGAPDRYVNARGIFPAILLIDGAATCVAVKVESISDFLFAQQLPLTANVRGEPGSQLRMVCAFKGTNTELWAIERHGLPTYEVPKADPARAIAAQKHLEALRSRRRDFVKDADGFTEANRLIDAAIKDLGRDWACDLFFKAERDYWQSRNRAARFQYERQNALGLGWANHDHHTYRSSRHTHSQLIAFMEKIGFHCRERFYAGAEAGWGAQVIEQPVTGITIFADVDMSPEELLGDFSHQGLAPREKLGTIGLWCALHGEAFLQAGMHHLECQFDWHALRDQMLTGGNIKTMDPFTTFPYLRQAFTEGERWAVREDRIAAVLATGQITANQAAQFRTHGALGSHLENLERNDGFKGFNQQGVSAIISKTDPRKQAAMHAEPAGSAH